ncbi:MAG: SH3 domain-containing protein [Chloroflexota bacterium]
MRRAPSGVRLTEIYTPHATWSRVKSAAQGARVLMYLGHGNGWPSPYTSVLWPDRQDGFGLNPSDGSGTSSPVQYIGESTIGSAINLAPGAIVLLNHLCYASGAGESGMANPSWSLARQRVDNYAAGFISAGASAVLSDAHDISDELRLALSTGQNFLAGWKDSPNFQDNIRSFASQRRSGFTNYLDPDNANSGFYRALTTKASFVTGVPVGPLASTTQTAVVLRSGASTSASRITSIADGSTLQVTGALRHDSAGRTWAPVKTASGRSGYVAAWLTKFKGSAVTVTRVALRRGHSTSASLIGGIKAGTRLKVTGSFADSRHRVWLAVRTSAGKVGWVAGWQMTP